MNAGLDNFAQNTSWEVTKAVVLIEKALSTERKWMVESDWMGDTEPP